MAIKMPLVGMIELLKPSPQVKAKTAVWRVMPRVSESGAINGMVTAAGPLPEGLSRLRVDSKPNMPMTAT